MYSIPLLFFITAAVTCLQGTSTDLDLEKMSWKVMEPEPDHPQKVVAFYNVFAEGGSYKGIVNDQVRKMESSGVMDVLDVVYYATMGSEGASYTIDKPKFKHLIDYGATGSEMETHSILYEFCKTHVDSKVLYFHNKGSFHDNPQNQQMREFLDCFNLNPNCVSALDTYDTCGMRFTFYPQPHYSGNFWWAQCKYINTLVDPLSPYNNQTFQDVTNKLSDCTGAKGRYFAEAWIGSPPNMNPADCMSAEVDTTFLYGYKFPYGVTQKYCPHGVDQVSKNTWGLECTQASTTTDPSKFEDALRFMSGLRPGGCVSPYQDVRKRTYAWYGQDAHSYLEWTNSMLPEPIIGKTYRALHNTEVFRYEEDGMLHSIPNLKTFYSLGIDFSETIVLGDFQFGMLKRGNPMPSK